jgi:hypothetical protein
VPLVWGKPDEKTSAAAERGEIIHAGNVIWKEFLDFQCKACGHQWTDPKLDALASGRFKQKM